MSDRVKAQLAGWAVGVITMVAISLGCWSLSECHALGEEAARQAQETKDLRELLQEVRADVKQIIRKLSNER